MQLVGAWLVWVADQSEAGFGEAQLATYGIRPFGSTGSCENITFTHSVARGERVCVCVGWWWGRGSAASGLEELVQACALGSVCS